MQELAGAAALIARAEGLTAHARALEMRIEGRSGADETGRTMDQHSKSGIMRLVRPELLGMAGYEPVEPVEAIAAQYGVPLDRVAKLDGNENPYGPSLAVQETLHAPTRNLLGSRSAQSSLGACRVHGSFARRNRGRPRKRRTDRFGWPRAACAW